MTAPGRNVVVRPRELDRQPLERGRFGPQMRDHVPSGGRVGPAIDDPLAWRFAYAGQSTPLFSEKRKSGRQGLRGAVIFGVGVPTVRRA